MLNGKISVIMGIYNCDSTLQAAIESIQNQTYKNWEIIICEDGSSDCTYKVAEMLAENDRRIKLIRNNDNMGLAYCLNRCLEFADGEYIARMDGDDLSVSTRFEEEIRFLKSNPQAAFVSTQMILFDESGEWGKTFNPLKPTIEHVVCSSPFCHAPTMFRSFAMKAVGGYTDKKSTFRVEDVDLWIKLYSKGFYGENLPRYLYMMRNDRAALNRRKYRFRINSTRTRLRGCAENNLSLRCCLKCFKPILVGLVPSRIRDFYRRNINQKA